MNAAWLLLLLLVVWFSYRYAWWRSPVDYRYPRILMYHMIAAPKPGSRYNGLRVSLEQFERQLDWLSNNGWTSFFASELVNSEDDLPNKSYAITFDDGFEDNLTHALPLLKKYACKATLYLVVDRFDRDWSRERKAHHDDEEIKHEKKLTDTQVKEMLASELIELGSHGMTHANFTRLNREQTEQELQQSKKILEETFNIRIESFAYPFGLYTSEQVEMIKQAGYSNAVTTVESIEAPALWDALQLPRIKISGKDNFLAFRMRMRAGRRGW